MGDDSQRYSVTFKAVEDADLSFDSGVYDLNRALDTEDDMSDEEDWAQETIEK